MSYIRKEVIGDCTLILGDCMEVMPTLGKVDAVVTDPPYGIGESGGVFRDRKGGGVRVLPKKEWDKSRPNVEILDFIAELECKKIIWGGNYFADRFPASKSWLYWDKLMGGDFADGELAWTNLDRALRKFTLCNKMKGKQHPTQKPVALMEWCLGFLPDANTILDPFMGSGTTLVACAKMGRSGIGIELDPDYFEIACERVRKAYAQADMFVAAPSNSIQPTQEGFDL
jgi:DNA modification methylase